MRTTLIVTEIEVDVFYDEDGYSHPVLDDKKLLAYIEKRLESQLDTDVERGDVCLSEGTDPMDVYKAWRENQ
jgi:hypothetical protein